MTDKKFIQLTDLRIRKHSGSLIMFNLFSPLIVMLMLAPVVSLFGPVLKAIPIEFHKVISNLFIYGIVGVTLFCAWKLSKVGMTFRHLIFGYRILKVSDEKSPNVLMLYLREVVAFFAGMLWGLKMMIPSKTFLQSYSKGQLADMYAEEKWKDAQEKARLKQEGFLHDKIFNTCAVNASRVEMLKIAFGKREISSVPSSEHVNRKAS